jgi:hypothetical protein
MDSCCNLDSIDTGQNVGVHFATTTRISRNPLKSRGQITLTQGQRSMAMVVNLA